MQEARRCTDATIWAVDVWLWMGGQRRSWHLLPGESTRSELRIELEWSGTEPSIRWPISYAQDSAAWVRQVLA